MAQDEKSEDQQFILRETWMSEQIFTAVRLIVEMFQSELKWWTVTAIHRTMLVSD